MNIEEFRGLVEKRRSTRGYDETREVSDDMIKLILDCARWAPSGGNGQPWEFIVVRERAVRYKIADFYMKQLEQKREMDLAVRGTAKMTGDGFRHAPVHIIVLGDPRVKDAYPIRTKLEKAESHFVSTKKRGEDYRWRRILPGSRSTAGDTLLPSRVSPFGSDRTARFESVVTRTAAN